MATLPGGSATGTTLYYSNSNSVGYQAALNILKTIGSDFGTSPADTVGGGTSSPTGGTGHQVLDINTNLSTVTAANYSAIIDSATGPVRLDISNSSLTGGTGNTSIVAGSGGGRFLVTDNSNVTISGGDGNFQVGRGQTAGNMDLTLGNGNNTISALHLTNAGTVPSAITTGSGSNVINLNSGNVNILLNGNGSGIDTINAGIEGSSYDPGTQVNISVAGGAADRVLLTENLASISFTNGAGISTIRGGGGSTTINAGGSGAVLYYAETYDFFNGGPQGVSDLTTLNDNLVDNSSSNDTLIAGAGNSVINAAGSTGNVLLESGSGNATLTGSNIGGVDTFQVGSEIQGSHSITINNFTAADTFNIQGTGGAPISAAPTVSGGNTSLMLNDGTIVTFTGYTGTIHTTFS